jgi:AbrB family looped-hinge helix DNA binding protein
MAHQSAKITKGGRLTLPAEFRRQLSLRDGDKVMIHLDCDQLRITSQMAAVRRLQAKIKELVPEGVSLVDELIAERKAEAARE